MRFTLHSRHRMSRRGIPQRLVAFALQHGRVEGDRHVLDRREAELIAGADALLITAGADMSADSGPFSGSGRRALPPDE